MFKFIINVNCYTVSFIKLRHSWVYKNLVVEPSSYIVAHHSIPYDTTILRSSAADCPIFYLF